MAISRTTIAIRRSRCGWCFAYFWLQWDFNYVYPFGLVLDTNNHLLDRNDMKYTRHNREKFPSNPKTIFFNRISYKQLGKTWRFAIAVTDTGNWHSTVYCQIFLIAQCDTKPKIHANKILPIACLFSVFCYYYWAFSHTHSFASKLLFAKAIVCVANRDATCCALIVYSFFCLFSNKT